MDDRRTGQYFRRGISGQTGLVSKLDNNQNQGLSKTETRPRSDGDLPPIFHRKKNTGNETVEGRVDKKI